jgi:uncharacterized protein
MTRGAAVAVFVKTPGLSPIKTRLAASAGAVVAREFYRRALTITESVVARAVLADADLTPYWAVAERDGLRDDRWQSFPTVWQGEGSLGPRLGRVYAELGAAHGTVLLIGADSPLLTPGHLRNALQTVAAGDRRFVLGRALDGGFYLFGGNAGVPAEVWNGVEYSLAHTADQLVGGLRPLGGMVEIPPLPDVDTLDDLRGLPAHSSPASPLLPSQRSLLEWVAGLGRSGRPTDSAPGASPRDGGC